MFRDRRTFEQQFQWEVDRLVFRHRQRGVPIEVSDDERERMVERYAARLRLARGAMLIGMVFGAAMIGMVSRFVGDGRIIGFGLFGSLVVTIAGLDHWSFDGTTAGLRKRPAIGEPLGAAGGFVRGVNAIKARDLWLALAFVAALGVMVVAAGGGAGFGLLTVPIIGGVLVMLALMLLAKGALHERDRLRGKRAGMLRRARGLRAD